MIKNKTQVDILGAPSDLGANIRGAGLGPEALRAAGLNAAIEALGLAVTDKGNLAVPVRDALSDKDDAEKYLGVVEKLCSAIYDQVWESLAADRLPLMIGGDHSLAVGSISAASDWARKGGQELGVIWVDAHADINTPQSSPSGNIHGMPLGALLGSGHDCLVNLGGKGPKLNPANVALIGIRTIDSVEKKLVRDSGITYFTMRDIDEQGIFKVMEKALSVAGSGTGGIHLSFDLDGIDPLYAPGVSTPVQGGLTYREAHLLLEMIADGGQLCSMDFVELNPLTDRNQVSAKLMVELIESALGKAIV